MELFFSIGCKYNWRFSEMAILRIEEVDFAIDKL